MYLYVRGKCIANISVKTLHVYICVNMCANLMFHVCDKFTHRVQT